MSMPAYNTPTMIAPDSPDLRRALVGVFLSYHVPVQDIDDLVQDVLLLMVQHADTIQHVRAWSRGVAANKAKMYWRDKHRRPEFVDLSEDLVENARHGLTVDDRLDLERVLRRLTVQQKRVLGLGLLGYTSIEMSRGLGLEEGSVRKMRQRAVRRLRRI